jgi:hypothetical protein
MWRALSLNFKFVVRFSRIYKLLLLTATKNTVREQQAFQQARSAGNVRGQKRLRGFLPD